MLLRVVRATPQAYGSSAAADIGRDLMDGIGTLWMTLTVTCMVAHVAPCGP